LRDLLQPVALPAYSAAYVLVTLLMLAIMRARSSHLLPWVLGETPERMVERYAVASARADKDIVVSMPLCGQWRVYQGPDGAWTHQGKWRHACDFEALNADGRSFSGDGMALTDYAAFGKPVVSPIKGRVVTVVSHLPDEAPGTVNHANNWGNHVVIYDWRGVYVLEASVR
jgi:hypothetical protein